MTVAIYTTAQSYRVRIADDAGRLEGSSHVHIGRFTEPFTETAFDPRARRWIVVRKYRYFNEKTKWIHLPFYDLPRFQAYLTNQGQDYTLIPIAATLGKSVEIEMKPWFQPKDDLQAGAINYVVHHPGPVVGLALQTGRGKTATLIAALSQIGRRAMVCVGGLVDQWVEAIKNFTLLKDEDIYIIQGAASITKLLLQIDKKIHPKIILVSLATLRQYALDKDAYENYPDFNTLCDKIDVGVRATDEAHLNFYLNLMLDLRLNAARNVVLTATFDNSKPELLKIFDQHYPPALRYGEGVYDRYVDIFAYSYRTGYGDIPTHAYKGKEGYSHAKLEGWLLKHPHKINQIWDDVWSPLIFGHYINKERQPGEKLLVLCATIAMCEYVIKKLRKELQGYKIELYAYESDEAVLSEADIIVSTPGSAGTGTDIKNLRTMLVTLSIRSSPLNKQTLGRLRKLPNATPEFVYCYNTEVPPQVDHAKVRADIFRQLGQSYTEHHL